MKNKDYDYYKELVLSEIPLEPCGKHHKEIARNVNLGLYDTRYIIKMLRNEGYAICSNPTDGYWMARTKTEVQEVINMFDSYIQSMQHTVNKLIETRGNYNE